MKPDERNATPASDSEAGTVIARDESATVLARPAATDAGTILATPTSAGDAGTMMATPTSPDAGTILASTPHAAASRASAGAALTHIGQYRILEKLGEGGMGVVYLAFQERPFKREVALKVIKLGMDTHEVVARFEAERQALARMDHPNIASVFDAGATDDGRPYFVMERVVGSPITEYCDERRLSTRARLELFVDVCGALQHAHQKGIIHRDIKPSNVLVSEQDGKAVPKVIDFGIAKATDRRDAADAQFTQVGLFVGTPEYMSPEQAGVTGLDVDSRTDIYSLGILLYELLVGAVPFDAKRLRMGDYAEIQRIIRDEEPARPSTRLSSFGATATEIAGRRLTSAPTLGRDLRGDLDWITLKAIEKDRDRRYESASEFSADIARYLRNEPVNARPPSMRYRATKFVARHRMGVVAASIVSLAIIGGLIASTLLYVQAERAKGEATRQKSVAEQEAQQANEARARAVSERTQADAARQDAVVQRTAAEQAAVVATSATARAEEQRGIAEQRACAANLLAADVSMKALNRPEARRRLDACPPAVRGWEWSYLDRMLDSSWLSLRGVTGGRWLQLGFSPDGQRVNGVIMEGAGFAGRTWLATPTIEKPDGPRAVTKAAAGSEIAVSRDGRLAIVTTWAAANVARDGDVFQAVDDKKPAAPAPKDIVRLRDLATGRDIATLEIPDAGRTTAPKDFRFRASLSAAGYLPLSLRLPLPTPTSAPPPPSGASTGSTGPQRVVTTAGGAPLPAPAPNPSGIPQTLAELETFRKQLLEQLGIGSTAPQATVSGAFPYVVDAAFSADGTRVAVWSWSNEIRVWDTRAARLVGTLTGHTDGVSSVAFSPDNARLISGSHDRTVRVWDIAQQKMLVSLAGHTGSVLAVAVSPDGARIASGGADGSVRVWNSTDYKTAWTRTDVGITRTVAFSPDGRWLASAGDDTTIRIWDAQGKFGVAQLRGHSSPVNVIAFSPDSRTLASGADRSDASIRLWSVAEAGFDVMGAHGSRLDRGTIAWIDRDILVSTGSDRTVRAWRAPTAELLKTLKVPLPPMPQDAAAAGMNPEVLLAAMTMFGGAPGFVAGGGGLFARAGDEPSITVWAGQNERPLRTLDTGQSTVYGLALSADGNRLFAILSDRGRVIRSWNPRTGEALASSRMDDYVYAMSLSPDGQWLVSAVGALEFTVRDARTLRIVRTIANQGRDVAAVAFSPDGRRLAVASGDKSISIRDFATGTVLRTVIAPSIATALAYSPDGHRIASNVDEGAISTVRLWDAESLEAVLTLTHEGIVHGEGEAPAQDTSLQLAGPILAGSAVTQRPTAQFLTFSPDGLELASAWTDGTIRVFAATPKTGWQHARDLINGFVQDRVFVEDMVDRLNADRSLSSEARDVAIKFARSRTDSLTDLTAASLGVVVKPGAAAADYQLALRRAEAAVLQSPDAARVNTVGLALYRVGKYREALDMVARAASLRPQTLPNGQKTSPNEFDMVVSALIRTRLGQANDARKDLEALRGRRSLSLDVVRLLGEAESLVDAGDPNARKARELTNDLFAQSMFTDEVADRIESDAKLTPGVKAAALRMANARVDDPAALNTASWNVVKKPGADPAEYRLALRRAEAAVRLEPISNRMNTLALAQYRVGQFETALATVTRGISLRPATATAVTTATDTAVIVMCRLKLGQRAAAQADLDKLLAVDYSGTLASTAAMDLNALVKEVKALAAGR